jgi:hypothetical protein
MKGLLIVLLGSGSRFLGWRVEQKVILSRTALDWTGLIGRRLRKVHVAALAVRNFDDLVIDVDVLSRDVAPTSPLADVSGDVCLQPFTQLVVVQHI